MVTARNAGAALFALLLLLSSTTMFGQNPSGAFQGVVVDATGARVVSAKVVVRALASSQERASATDVRGEFRVEGLQPGSYRIIVNAPGFSEAAAEVKVAVSSVTQVSVKLKPALAEQTVTVSGQASSITTQPLDTISAVHQGVVTAGDLETIPLAHRSFANIAYLVPGTEPVEPSDPTKARITAVSFGGSSGLNVEASVDGGDNTDDYIGGFLQNFSPEGLQEFAVRTSQEEADTGRTTAGSVVITTKRGTDVWHGSAAFYERAAALNARFPIDNPEPQPKQPFSRQNYIGSVGGPIVKSKLWFFSALEAIHENASINYNPASLAQFNALAQLAANGLIPGVASISVPGHTPVPFRDYLGQLRLDWTQSDRSHWFLRGAGDNYTTHDDLVQQATLPSTGASSFSNYLSLVINNQYDFSSNWLGSFTFNSSYLHHTEKRNSNLGFALAFPFSSTTSTISGFETFGDNQFVTGITAFPVLRNQEKHQFRYDVNHLSGRHAVRIGVGFIHEPVLSGRLTDNPEILHQLPNDPSFYLVNPGQFTVDFNNQTSQVINCPAPPCNGSFSQNVQRLGLYGEDSWRVTQRLTLSLGLRYDTTFGLFEASGRGQSQNPALLTLQSLQIPLISGTPQDYRKEFGPRVGIVYSLSPTTVIRFGSGVYFNDLAQNGWVQALQAVNTPLSASCVHLGDPGCLFGGANGAVIDPHYHTPYALHATAGMEHAFGPNWTASADWTHETGMHAYRRYQYTEGVNLFTPLFPADDTKDQSGNVPNLIVFRTDNRSRYDGLSLHMQGNVARRLNLVLNYTLASAETWGCQLGELFDYVNGVCDPLHPFAKGDYGPSGEDVRHRFVAAGTVRAPAGFQVSLLSQLESARPFTLTSPTGGRAVVNGVETSLDQLRGTPYMQVDLRVSRPFNGRNERWSLMPFIEFFNLFNRSNPGANYVTNVAALPVDNASNVTALCPNGMCIPVTNVNQLRVPAGGLGDFFGPGTTVGIPFAAQMGVRFSF